MHPDPKEAITIGDDRLERCCHTYTPTHRILYRAGYRYQRCRLLATLRKPIGAAQVRRRGRKPVWLLVRSFCVQPNPTHQISKGLVLPPLDLSGCTQSLRRTYCTTSVGVGLQERPTCCGPAAILAYSYGTWHRWHLDMLVPTLVKIRRNQTYRHGCP